MERKCIIPAAGLGTRMIPITGGKPKEALSIDNTSVIDYCINEINQSSVFDKITVVSNPEKQELNDFLNKNYSDIEIMFQHERRGLANAINIGLQHITVDDFVGVALPDELCLECDKMWQKMWDIGKKHEAVVLGTKIVPLTQAHLYGIVVGTYIDYDVIDVDYIVEKPPRDLIPSRVAAMGRYLFPKKFIKYIKNDLTTAFEQYIKDGGSIYAVDYEGIVFDCGSVDGYRDAIEYFSNGAPTKKESIETHPLFTQYF